MTLSKPPPALEYRTRSQAVVSGVATAALIHNDYWFENSTLALALLREECSWSFDPHMVRAQQDEPDGDLQAVPV